MCSGVSPSLVWGKESREEEGEEGEGEGEGSVYEDYTSSELELVSSSGGLARLHIEKPWTAEGTDAEEGEGRGLRSKVDDLDGPRIIASAGERERGSLGEEGEWKIAGIERAGRKAGGTKVAEAEDAAISAGSKPVVSAADTTKKRRPSPVMGHLVPETAESLESKKVPAAAAGAAAGTEGGGGADVTSNLVAEPKTKPTVTTSSPLGGSAVRGKRPRTPSADEATGKRPADGESVVRPGMPSADGPNMGKVMRPGGKVGGAKTMLEIKEEMQRRQEEAAQTAAMLGL